MPIYEYRCQDCDKVFEKIERSFDEHAEACPVCGGESKRIISNTSFVLKGSGWYVTDYCNRHGGAESGGNGDSGSKAKDGATSDSASAASDAASPASSASSASSAPSASGTSGGKAPAATSCSTACGSCGAAAAK